MPFLLSRCCNIIEPSGIVVAVVVVVAVDAILFIDATVPDAFDVVAIFFFKACVECNRTVAGFVVDVWFLTPFPLNVFASIIWFVVRLAFFKVADWITYFWLVDSFVICFGVVVTVFDTVVVLIREFCNRIDGDDVGVPPVVLISSLLLILTAPLFSKLSNSWPFCKIIWPFSVRAPRINIMLLGCCC